MLTLSFIVFGNSVISHVVLSLTTEVICSDSVIGITTSPGRSRYVTSNVVVDTSGLSSSSSPEPPFLPVPLPPPTGLLSILISYEHVMRMGHVI